MTSQLAWLDQDERQRRRMHAVLELFKDDGTVDELGVGSVRDAVADILFPATSVLHTRARYLLFIPWLLQRAARSAQPDTAAAEFRRLEVRLIYALLAGGEFGGVIGAQAKEKLKRMPSAAYWAALGTYGIRTWSTTIDGHFRAAAAEQRTVGPRSLIDEDGSVVEASTTGLHPDVPPEPDGLLSATDFALTSDEAAFLADRITSADRSSLMAWLLNRPNHTATEAIWQHPELGSFPPFLRDLVDQGRRFSFAIHGAPIIYNLMLAEQIRNDEFVDRYRAMYDTWLVDVGEERIFDDWDVATLWALLGERGRSISPATRLFVDRWTQVAAEQVSPLDDRARRLVRDRETFLKGGRARLVNRAAQDAWRGDSGLVRLDYRWGVATRYLDDIDAARALGEAT